MPTISGIVKDEFGQPCQAVVRAQLFAVDGQTKLVALERRNDYAVQ